MIVISTPMYGNMCTAAYHQSLIKLIQAFGDYPYSISTCLNESLIDRARNNEACRFLEGDWKKLFFIDADIEFEPEHVAQILEYDLPLVAGVYAMKKPGQEWFAAWHEGKLVTELDGSLIEGDYAGTGFMCIDREVFETIQAEMPGLENESDEGERWGFFNRMKVDGVNLSEDYAFCHRAKECGFKVHIDTSIKLIHHGTYPYGRAA